MYVVTFCHRQLATHKFVADAGHFYLGSMIIGSVVTVMNVMMNANFRILRVLCENVRLAPELNLQHLAQLTPGYVGVDLRFLVTKAGQICIKRFLFILHFGKN